MNNAGRIGFLLKGDYNSDVTYDFLDVVYYNGASYVAKKLTTGNDPERSNEYWQIFAEGGTLTSNGDISDTTVTFTQAENRVNVSTGEKMSIFAGKVKKFFSDLKTVAFTGNFGDLLNAPESVNNLESDSTTDFLAAAQGKVLDDKITELNRKWKANTVTNAGYVSAGSGQANKVWKTDANGNPAWRNDEDTTYPVSILSKPTFVNCTDAGTLVFKMGNVVTANVAINVSSSGVPNNTLAYITGLPKSRYALQVSAVYFSGSRMYPTRLRLGTDGILSNWYSGESYAANNPIICNFSYPV